MEPCCKHCHNTPQQPFPSTVKPSPRFPNKKHKSKAQSREKQTVFLTQSDVMWKENHFHWIPEEISMLDIHLLLVYGTEQTANTKNRFSSPLDHCNWKNSAMQSNIVVLEGNILILESHTKKIWIRIQLEEMIKLLKPGISFHERLQNYCLQADFWHDISLRYMGLLKQLKDKQN